MGGMVGLWGANSLIRSVQRGTFSNADATTGTSTIVSVTPENCVGILLGSQSGNNGSAQSGDLAQWSLVGITNATTVSFSRAAANGVARACSFEIWEFNPGLIKSLQYAAISTGSSGSGTVTITAVNTSKSWLIPCGWQQQTVSVFDNVSYASVTLTNATTVTLARDTAAASIVSGRVCVVEFF